jgi:hypothetical protein
MIKWVTKGKLKARYVLYWFPADCPFGIAAIANHP